MRKAYEEVISAVFSSFDCLNWALDDHAKGASLIRVAARAASRADTLRLLASHPGISDDASSSCHSAAQSMHQIVEAAYARADRGYEPTDAGQRDRHLNAALALSHEARERLTDVSIGENLTFSAYQDRRPLPNLWSQA